MPRTKWQVEMTGPGTLAEFDTEAAARELCEECSVKLWTTVLRHPDGREEYF